jgi:hypothetical protein
MPCSDLSFSEIGFIFGPPLESSHWLLYMISPCLHESHNPF